MSITKLQKFGLTDKEARVYVALFELGNSVVTDVAKRAGVNRSTAYVLIEALLHRGLISVSERRGVKIFSAVAPDKLTEIAQSKYSEASELLKVSKELAEDLKKLKKSDVAISRTKVNVFEGKEGVKVVEQDLAATKHPISAVITGSADKLAIFERVNGKAKIILEDSPATRSALKDLKSSKQDFLLSSEIDGDYSLAIYGNKVNFISHDNDSSFIIESPQFARAVLNLYNLVQNRAKKWNVKTESGKTTQNKSKDLVNAQKRFLGDL